MENMDTDIRVWQLREDIKKMLKKKKKKQAWIQHKILPTYMKSSFWLVLLYFN